MKFAITLFLFACLVACHGSKKATSSLPVAINTSDSVSGLKMIEEDNCFTCHKKDDPMVGPSFNDIATKYDRTAGTLQKLSKKIINGGSGVWGQVPMVPHPNLSDTDAKMIVKYILSLKK